jgi:hypothetical protein
MGTDSLQKAIVYALCDAVRMGLVKLSDFDSDGDGAIDMLTVYHRCAFNSSGFSCIVYAK